MIKIAIIEDESVAARNIERILSEISIKTEVTVKLESVKEAIAILPSIELDLILLDIHLLDGNAFQIFKQIEVTTPIIFTTAFDNYAIRSFKQNSIDYLLKPIKKSDLLSAILKYKNLFDSELSLKNNNKLLTDFFKQKKFRKQYLIQVGKKLLPVRTQDIAYFYVENKSIFLHTFNNKTHLSDFSLSQIESEIDPNLFYRVNRQFLINSKAIKNIYYETINKLKVNCEPEFKDDIWVSIHKITKFKKWLNR